MTPRRIGERMTKALADSSWTARSLDVLARACDHYGGFETWDALSEIRLLPESAHWARTVVERQWADIPCSERFRNATT